MLVSQEDRDRLEGKQFRQRLLVEGLVALAIIVIVYLVVKISKTNEMHRLRIPERWQTDLVALVERHVLAKTKAAQKLAPGDSTREKLLREALMVLEIVERLGGFPVLEAKRGYNMSEIRKHIESKLFPGTTAGGTHTVAIAPTQASSHSRLL